MSHGKLKIHTMLQQLIANPSVSCVSPKFDQSNMGVTNLLACWLEDLGFSCELMPLPQQPNKANLIASLGKGPGGLVLAGHTDTVPYNEEQWSHDPFRLVEKDNRFYGLGICDMKGFFALVIEAVKRFNTADIKQPLIVLATADEESSMEGAKTLVELGRPKARYAVIGEPTGLRPVNMHKGIIMEAIHVYGHAGHSSNPSLGVNAIEGLYETLGMLRGWRDAMCTKHIDQRFEVPTPTLNLGLVSGGDNPNRICSHAQTHFDLRMLPGMHMDVLRRELDDKLHHLFSNTAYQYQRESLIEGTPAMHTDIDSPIVKTLERLTGYASEAVAFCTEGPYLNALGMDTVIMGPGDIAQAHQPDEYLEHSRIEPTVDIIERLIQDFCCK